MAKEAKQEESEAPVRLNLGLVSKTETKPEEKIEITSRQIPGHILQNTKKASGISSKDKYALAIYDQLPTPPTDLVLSRMLGGGETEESARQTRKKLQSLGVLEFSKNRAKVVLPEPPLGTHPDGLTINSRLFQLKEFSDRTVAAVEIAFANHNNGWKAWKVGIPLSTYLQAKARVSNIIPIYAFQMSVTQENHIPQPKKTIYPNPRKPYGISKDKVKIISKDELSKDNSKEPSVLFVKEVPLKEEPPSQQINSPIKKEYNMPIRIPFDTPAPAGLVNKIIRHLKLESVKPKNDFNKKKEVSTKHYPMEVTLDMNWIRDNLNLVRSPRTGTDIYHEDTRVIKALIYGPSNYLRPDEIQAIINNMKGTTMPGGNYPLTEKTLRERFLDKKFSQAERRELYLLLNNMLGVDYGGKGEKIYLSGAMRSHKGHSFLARVWMANPVKVIKQMPVDFKSVERQLEQAMDIIPEKIMPEEKSKLASNIINLKKRYIQEYRLKMNGNGCNSWPSFFEEFLDSIESAAEIINPGWFNPDNKPVKKFLYNIGVYKPTTNPEPRQFFQPTL